MHAKLDHTKIDMTLYKAKKETSTKTVTKPEDSRGLVHIIIQYDPVGGLLNVRLIEAQNLRPCQAHGFADPYAKIRLLPDRTLVYHSKIHKKTLNPGNFIYCSFFSFVLFSFYQLTG